MDSLVLARTRRFRYNATRGFTLIELVTASVLLAVIMATFYTVYISANNIFRDITARADVNLNAAIAMNHMYRHLVFSSGISSVAANGLTIDFFEDINGTPENPADDILSRYRTVSGEIRYTRDVNGNPSTSTVAENTTMSITSTVPNYIEIHITATHPQTGEQVYLNSSVLIRPHAAV